MHLLSALQSQQKKPSGARAVLFFPVLRIIITFSECIMKIYLLARLSEKHFLFLFLQLEISRNAEISMLSSHNPLMIRLNCFFFPLCFRCIALYFDTSTRYGDHCRKSVTIHNHKTHFYPSLTLPTTNPLPLQQPPTYSLYL